MDKFTRRSLLVGGALLSKVSAPNFLGTTIVNVTNQITTFPDELVGSQLRINVIRSNLGTNEIHTIDFNSRNSNDVIEAINATGRVLRFGIRVDIFKASLSRDVLHIQSIDPEIDGMEILDSTAVRILGFFASPDIRGISLIENWRYSTVAPDRQNLGVGSYLIKYEDRTSESVNRAIDSVARNVEEVERQFRIPTLIDRPTYNFQIFKGINNQLESIKIYQEGTWIEGPLEAFSHNCLPELINAFGQEYFDALEQKHFSTELKLSNALDILESDVFNNNSIIRGAIINKLRTTEFAYYSPVTSLLDEYGESVKIANENTGHIHTPDKINTLRPWNSKYRINAISATNLTQNQIARLSNFNDVDLASPGGLTFNDFSSTYADFAGSFLGPVFNVQSKVAQKVTTGIVKDYLTLEISEDLFSEAGIRNSLLSKETEILVLTECGVFELTSLLGRTLKVKPWSGDLNRFLLAPNNNIEGGSQLLVPGKQVRVCLLVGRKLPRGLFLVSHDPTTYALDDQHIADASYYSDLTKEVKSILVRKELSLYDSYLEDLNDLTQEHNNYKLYQAIDPYRCQSTSPFTSLRNLFSCSERYTNSSKSFIPPTTTEISINRRGNLNKIGANTTSNLSIDNAILQGISSSFEEKAGITDSLTLRTLNLQSVPSWRDPDGITLSDIVRTVYNTAEEWLRSRVINGDHPVSIASEVAYFLESRTATETLRDFIAIVLEKVYGAAWKARLFTGTGIGDDWIPHPADASLSSNFVAEICNLYSYLLAVCPYSTIMHTLSCTVNLRYGIVVILSDSDKNPYSPYFDIRDIGRNFYLRNSAGKQTAVKLVSVGSPREGRFILTDNTSSIGISYNAFPGILTTNMTITPGLGIQSSGHAGLHIKQPGIIKDITVLDTNISRNKYAVGVPVISESVSTIDLFRFNNEDVNSIEAYNSIETRSLLIPNVSTKLEFLILEQPPANEPLTYQKVSRYPVGLTVYAPINFMSYYGDFDKDQGFNKKRDLPNIYDGNIQNIYELENTADFISAHKYNSKTVSLWEKKLVDRTSDPTFNDYSLAIEEAKVNLIELLTLTKSSRIELTVVDFLDIVFESRENAKNTRDALFAYLEEAYVNVLPNPQASTFGDWMAYIAEHLDPTRNLDDDDIEDSKDIILANLAEILAPPGNTEQHAFLKNNLKVIKSSQEALKALGNLNTTFFKEPVSMILTDTYSEHLRKTINLFIYTLLLSGVKLGHKKEADADYTYLSYEDFGKKAAFEGTPSSNNFQAYIVALNNILDLDGDINTTKIRLEFDNVNTEGLLFNLSEISQVRDTAWTNNLARTNGLAGVEGLKLEQTHPISHFLTSISNLKVRANTLSSIKVNTNGPRSAPAGYSSYNKTDDPHLQDISLYKKRRSKGLLPWYFSDSETVGNPQTVTASILTAVEMVGAWAIDNPDYLNMRIRHKVAVTPVQVLNQNGANEYYLLQKSYLGFYKNGLTSDISDDPDVILIPAAGGSNLNRERDVMNDAMKLTGYHGAIFLEELSFKLCKHTKPDNLSPIFAQSNLTIGNGILLYPEFITDDTNNSKLIEISYEGELLELNSETRQALSHFFTTTKDTYLLSKASVELESRADTSNFLKIRNSDNSYKTLNIESTSHKTLGETFTDNKYPLVSIGIQDKIRPYSNSTKTSSALKVFSTSTDALEVGLNKISSYQNDLGFGDVKVSPKSSLFVYSNGAWEAINSTAPYRTWENADKSKDIKVLSFTESTNWHNLYSTSLDLTSGGLDSYNTQAGGDIKVAAISAEMMSSGGPVLSISNSYEETLDNVNSAGLPTHPKKDSVKFRKSALLSVNTKDFGRARVSIPYHKFADVHYERRSGEFIGNTVSGFGYDNAIIPEDEYNRMYSILPVSNDSENIASIFSLGTTKLQGTLRISGDTPDSIFDQCNLFASNSLNSGIFGHLNPVEAPRASKYWSYLSYGELVKKVSKDAYLKNAYQGVEDVSSNLLTHGTNLQDFSPNNLLAENTLGITLNPRSRFGASNAPSQLGEKVASATFQVDFDYNLFSDKRTLTSTEFGPIYVKNGAQYQQDPFNTKIKQGISINYFLSNNDIQDDPGKDGFRFIFARPSLGFGEANIGRSIIFKLTLAIWDEVFGQDTLIPYTSPYFEGVIADIIIHDGVNERSVDDRLGTVEVIVVPAARRFDQITELQKIFPSLVPQNFYDIEPELLKLRNQANHNITSGIYSSVLARCASDYSDPSDRVWSWAPPGGTHDNINNRNSHAVRLEGVIHGREWTLNAFQVAVSDRMFVTDDLGNKKLSIYADREGDVHIEGNGSNLRIDGFNEVIINDQASTKNISVIVTCAIRRHLRRMTEAEWDLYGDVDAHTHTQNNIYKQNATAANPGNQYYLVQDEGMYTKMSYDWLIDGVSNTSEVRTNTGLNYTHSVLPKEWQGLSIDFNYISQYIGYYKQFPINSLYNRSQLPAAMTMQFALSSTVTLPNGNTLGSIPQGTYIVLTSNARFKDVNDSNKIYVPEPESVGVRININALGESDTILFNSTDDADEILFSNNHAFELDTTITGSYTFYFPTLYVSSDSSDTTIYNDSSPDLIRIKNDFNYFVSNVTKVRSGANVRTDAISVFTDLSTQYNNELVRAETSFNSWGYTFNDAGTFNGDLSSWLNGDGASLSVDGNGNPFNMWSEHVTELARVKSLIDAEAESMRFAGYTVDLAYSDNGVSFEIGSAPVPDVEVLKGKFSSINHIALETLNRALALTDTVATDYANDSTKLLVNLSQNSLVIGNTVLTAEKNADAGRIFGSLGVLTDRFWCNWYGTGDAHHKYPDAGDIEVLQSSLSGEIVPVVNINGVIFDELGTWRDAATNTAYENDIVSSITNRLYRGKSADEAHGWEYPLAGILNALKYPIITIPEDWELSSVNVSEMNSGIDIDSGNTRTGEPSKHRRSAVGLRWSVGPDDYVRDDIHIEGTHITGYNGLNKENETYLKGWSIVDQQLGATASPAIGSFGLASELTSFVSGSGLAQVGTTTPAMSAKNDFAYKQYSARQNTTNYGRLVFRPDINAASPIFTYNDVNRFMWTQQGPTASRTFNTKSIKQVVKGVSIVNLCDDDYTGGPYGKIGRVNGVLKKVVLAEKSVALALKFDISKINSLIHNAHPYTSSGAFWEDKYVTHDMNTIEPLLTEVDRTEDVAAYDNTGKDSKLKECRRLLENVASDTVENLKIEHNLVEGSGFGVDKSIDTIIKFRIDLALTKVPEKELNEDQVSLSVIRKFF